MTLSQIKFLLTSSRWNWYLRGLPCVDQARSLFLVRDYTMTTFKRCKNLWEIATQVSKRKIPGAFVECGVWRGGSIGLMGRALKHTAENRPLHLFDSFQGLPEPEEIDGVTAKEYSSGKSEGRLTAIARCEANLGEVQKFLLERLQLDPKNIHFHVGWFQDTVAKDAGQVGDIAILRLDGDWYASTRICLENLYPRLVPGGFVILDDYFWWEGCRKATDEFRAELGISAPIVPVDGECAYWIKP